MNQTPLIGILGGALAGSLCAGLVLVSFSPERIQSQSPAALTADSTSLAELSASLRELREENQALLTRLEQLELQPVARASERVAALPQEAPRDETLDQKVKQFVASMESPAAGSSPVILDAVSNALQTIREQEDRDRERERDEREAQRMEDRLTSLQEKLGLDRTQTDSMRTLLTTESIKRNELFTKARESGDFNSVREGMRELRDTTQTSLGQILTPSQLESYNSLDRDSGRGGWGRTGGDGGGTGGSSSGPGGGSGGGGGRGGRGGF